MDIRSKLAYSLPAKILSRLVCPSNCRPAWVRDYWAGFTKSPWKIERLAKARNI